MQRSLRMIANPKKVTGADVALFEAEGYKSVDETQVVKIETGKYFRYLMDLVTSAGGALELGTNFTAEDIEELQSAGHVVNCLGSAAGSVGGAEGEYYSNPGEVVIWKNCPQDFGFYVMDDDHDGPCFCLQQPYQGQSKPRPPSGIVTGCAGHCLELPCP